MRWVKRGVWVLVALALAALVFQAFRPPVVSVQTAKVTRGALRVTVDGTGRTRVRDRYVVTAPVSGELDRIALRAGDPVQAGDAVATVRPARSPLLDPRTRGELEARKAAAESAKREADLAIGRVRLAADLARRERDRLERLGTAGAAPERDLDVARFEADAREREVRQAELAAVTAARSVEVARVMLRAGDAGAAEGIPVPSPAAGRVLRVFQESGGPVMAGTPLLEIGDPADLEAVVDLPTPDAVAVRPGMAVELVRWGGSEPLKGRVRRIEPSAFTKISALGVEEQRVNVVIEPPAGEAGVAPWPALADGYRVEARIIAWEGTDVVSAPVGAVFRRGDAWQAFAVVEGRAALRAVEVGHRGAWDVEVLKGLAAGDAVIVHPGEKLQDGARVKDEGD